jgi:hypothetical protein
MINEEEALMPIFLKSEHLPKLPGAREVDWEKE